MCKYGFHKNENVLLYWFRNVVHFKFKMLKKISCCQTTLFLQKWVDGFYLGFFVCTETIDFNIILVLYKNLCSTFSGTLYCPYWYFPLNIRLCGTVAGNHGRKPLTAVLLPATVKNVFSYYYVFSLNICTTRFEEESWGLPELRESNKI